MTLLPSFDSCSQEPPSNVTSSSAPSGCSIVHLSTQPTNNHQQFNILSVKSQNCRVNELGPFSNPPACIVLLVICSYQGYVCVLCVCLSHVLQPQHQYAAARTVCPCNPPSSLHLHLSQRPLSLYLSLLHSSAGTVTLSPGGQLNGCFARQMDGWMGAGVER